MNRILTCEKCKRLLRINDMLLQDYRTDVIKDSCNNIISTYYDCYKCLAKKL